MSAPMNWLLSIESHAGATAPQDQNELQALFRALSHWSHDHRGVDWDDDFRSILRRTYQKLGKSSGERYQLLSCLAWAGGASDLTLLAELLVADPPGEAAAAAAPLIPLLHSCRYPAALFPRLLDGLIHPSLAAAILDLANHLVRCGRLDRHPAADRVDVLIRLVDGLTSQLERLQRKATPSSQCQTQVDDSVAILIAACDGLAWIGDRRATRVLEQVAELRHRRLRVEALAALGRWAHPEAVERLALMAAEPSVRLRVLAYLNELDALSHVDETYRGPVAVAEAELVAYLAERTQFGIPPVHCELVDQTTLVWPGYEEPRDCYLFRYTYSGRLGDTPYALGNIGLAGPVAVSFPDDLTQLPPADLYAIFAGWHAEHPEIVPVEWNRTGADRGACQRLVAFLESVGCEAVRPCLMYRFFGTEVLAAEASQRGSDGTAVTDGTTWRWFAAGDEARAIAPERAMDWYRGWRLLSLFNHDWDR